MKYAPRFVPRPRRDPGLLLAALGIAVALAVLAHASCQGGAGRAEMVASTR